MGENNQAHREARVAVLVDCDNIDPDVLDHALRVAAQFGRVVMRRGYGNHTTLTNKWRDALVEWAFTPCLQFQYASGKNTSDIALAIDAMEVLVDGRADTFCLVTSDSDFVYLCRKLRERGATIHIVGEHKTPNALRNASDQFFEWAKTPVIAEAAPDKPAAKESPKTEPPKKEAAKPVAKQRPKLVVEAVALLTGDTEEGKVALSPLGSYLRRTYPSFSPQVYGHSGLLDMLKTYDLLELEKDTNDHWYVKLAKKPDNHADKTPTA